MYSFIDDDRLVAERDAITAQPLLDSQLPGEHLLLGFCDRAFEVLVHDVLNEEVMSGEHAGISKVRLTEVGKDKGRDVLLYEGTTLVGIAQCKRLSKTLGPAPLFKEVSKFLLHSLVDNSLIPHSNGFLYKMFSAGPVNGDASQLFDQTADFLKMNEKNILQWLLSVKNNFECLADVDVEGGLSRIHALLKSFDFELVRGNALIERALEKPRTREKYFSYKPVLDPEYFEKFTKCAEKQIYKKHPAEIAVVDVFLEPPECEETDGANSRLEIKLRNKGDEVAYIKAMNFVTIKHWDVRTDEKPSLREISATFDVDISKKVGSIAKLRTSLEVKPNETERIVVRFTTKHGDAIGLSLFHLMVETIYNENDSIATLPYILLNIQPPLVLQGSYFGGYAKGTVSRNKRVAEEILGLSLGQMVVEEGIVEALESWQAAPDET